MDKLQRQLEQTFGIDLSFDARFGLRGTKDLIAGDDDFVTVSGPAALAEELQRLFDLTERGALIDDPTYGIDWSFIGEALDPRVSVGLVKLAVLQALQHPSFTDRFRVRWIDASWQRAEPNVIRVMGILELYGFENIPYVRFGPYALKYLRNG